MANGQTTPKLMGHLRPQAMSSAQPFKGVQVANHEPYKWSHLWFRVNILSTELSSMLGSGVCSMSSNWDIVSPSFSCWSQSFPQKMSQVLCSKVQQPSPPVFLFMGHYFWMSLINVPGQTIRLFPIISIPSIFFYFRPPDHVISMD
jgi:hypothetical protein